jgi:DNA-binding transcriptional MerR regulator
MKFTYSSGEIAKLLHINRETLRFYERKGLIAPERADNKYRRYSYDDLLTLWEIIALRQAGASVLEIHELSRKDYAEAKQDIIKIIEKEQEQVQTHIACLERLSITLNLYETVEKNLGRISIKPDASYYHLPSDLLSVMEDVTGITELEHYRIEERRLIHEGNGLYIAKQYTCKAHPSLPIQPDDELLLTRCVYTVLRSATRRLEYAALNNMLAWANKSKVSLIGKVVTNPLMANTEGFFIETYLPLAASNSLKAEIG